MREVKQFHFQSWPDQKVPGSPSMMVDFTKAVRNMDKQKGSVICVHCR